MFVLSVKNKKGEVFSKNSFEERPELDKWLAAEQAKPQWQPDFVVQIDEVVVDLGDKENVAAEKVQRVADNAERKQLMQDMQTLAAKKNRALPDTNDLLDKVILFLAKS